jgi:hypothetical protein
VPPSAIRRNGLGRREVVLRLAQLLAQVRHVEVARRVRLLDEHEHAVLRDLDVALALRVGHDVRIAAVEAQLGRLEHAE